MAHLLNNARLEDFKVHQNDYVIEKKLTNGGCSIVYLARKVSDNSEVVIKQITKYHDYGMKEMETMMKMTVTRQLKDKIVPLLGYYLHKGNYYLIMPYYSHGSLRKCCFLFGGFSQFSVTTLQFFHQNFVLHRDIKTDNILVRSVDGEKINVLLTDFGFTKYVLGNPGETCVFTPGYNHPEIGNGVYGPEVDIYALGVVFYSLLTGNDPPVKGNTVEYMLNQKFPCEEAHDLLKKLLDVKNKQKPNDIKQHPYFIVDFTKKNITIPITPNPNIPDPVIPSSPLPDSGFGEYRILLVGDTKTGKRSILNSFTKQTENTAIKVLKLDNEPPVTIEVLKKSANGKNAVSAKDFKNATGIIFVYDKTSRLTFSEINTLWDKFKNEIISQTPILLIGNKSDLSSSVSKTEGEKFAKTEGMGFKEISTFNNEKIDQIFKMMAYEINKRLRN